MPRYQHAQTFDIVRSVKGTQSDIRTLQVAASPALVRKPLNAHVAALNPNPYFWGMDDAGWAATAGSFTIVSDPPDPSPYPYAALYVNDGSGAGAFMQSLAPVLIVPQQQYLVQAQVNSTATSIQIGFDWLDASLSPVSGPTDPSITVTPSTWTLISAIQQAPSNAAYAYPRVGSPSGDSALTYVTGITTQATAATIQPGTSPPVVETWHDFPAGINSWGLGTGGWKKYRLNGDGDLVVSISLRAIGTKTDGTAVFGSGALPAGYQVSVARRIPVSTSANALSANNTPWMGFLADGSVNISGVNVAGLNQVDCHQVIPLI